MLPEALAKLIVTSYADLYDGPWKYVVIAGEPTTIRFTPLVCGLHHKALVQSGEIPSAAGMIMVLAGEWAIATAESDTLGIDGDKHEDVKLLTEYLGCPPTL